MDKFIDAKKLFLKYGGSHFQMGREDGEYEKYLEYKVPKDMEVMWIDEYRSELFEQLETSGQQMWLIFKRICRLALDYSPQPELFIRLIEFIERKKTQLDSFTLLLMSEVLLREVGEDKHWFMRHSTVRSYTRDYALELLKELLDSKITVAEEHVNDKWCFFDLSEESIKERIKSDIRLYELGDGSSAWH